MAGCTTVFLLVTTINLAVTAVPGNNVSPDDVDQRFTLLETSIADFKLEAQRQALLTTELLTELSKATEHRRRLEQTISQLQTQIQSQEQHYQGVVAGLLSATASTEGRLVNLTKDYKVLEDKLATMTKDYGQLELKCNSSLDEIDKIKGGVSQFNFLSGTVQTIDQARQNLEKKVNEMETRQKLKDKELTDKVANLTTEYKSLSQGNISPLNANGAMMSNSTSTVDKELAQLTRDYKSLLQAQTRSTADLTQLKKDLTSNVNSLSSSVWQATKQGQVLTRDVSNLQRAVNTIKSSGNKVAAFTAYLQDAVTIDSGDVLTFDGTTLNVGEHFNTSTGVYTCPYSGVYVFHLHATGSGSQGFRLKVYTSVDIGGVSGPMSSKDYSPYSQTSTNTFMLRLTAGQQVSVRSSVVTSYLMGKKFTTFSGYLLSEG